MLTEGTDLPFVRTIGLVNPTLSWGRYLQQVGRGLRTSPETGKTYCAIMDHARCIRMHELPDHDRDYSLHQDARAKRISSREMPEPHECASCWTVYSRGAKVCPSCGVANPEWTGREVRELEAASVEDVGLATEDEQRAMLAEWIREGERAGKKGLAVARFMKRFGRFPPGEWMR
mgnify:CR=1 FL=1